MSCNCNKPKTVNTPVVPVQSTESTEPVARNCGGFIVEDDPETMDCGGDDYCPPKQGRLAAFSLESSDGVSNLQSSDGISKIGTISYI